MSNFCRTKMQKGGVAIYVKDHIRHQVIDVSSFCLEGYCELASIKCTMYCKSTLITISVTTKSKS